MVRYAFTIFLSAFLLFQVQPVVAKVLLPRFGGTSAVWTTCMMYFQVVLMLGYLYVHCLRRLCGPRAAWTIHMGLLLVAAVGTQLYQANEIVAPVGSSMVYSIIVLLSWTVGPSFFALSTTGPLVQAWHSLSHPTGETYRLYALSNIGSMLALLSYPFVFERYLGLTPQQTVWEIGFLLFVFFCCWSGWQTLAFRSWQTEESSKDSIPADSIEATLPPNGLAPSVVLWLVFSCLGSVILLAATNLMTQEVASYPFLWILPLALYLLSLIICFDRPQWYRRTFFSPLFLISVFISIVLIHVGTYAGLLSQVLGMSSVCFLGSMICHGELQRLKPATTHLTLFYLMMAAGGAIGGILVTVVAPMMLNGFYEFHFALLATLALPLCMVVLEANRRGVEYSLKIWLFGFGSLVAATFVGCSLYFQLDPAFHPNRILQKRNEYGTISIHDVDGYRILVNGQTDHGGQFLEGAAANQPSSYYIQGSGASIAFAAIRRWHQIQRPQRAPVASQPSPTDSLNVGVIGLGTGSLVTWGERGDQFRFFEINPLVVDVANDYFTYVKDANAEVLVGDGRVELERERALEKPKYDLLFVDAFSSDSIPTHLMTRECMELYRSRLKKNGILVFHITNRFVDLRPVVKSLADESGLSATLIDHDNEVTENQTRWVLLTANQAIPQFDLVQNVRTAWPSSLDTIQWTDEFASLAPVVIWSGTIDWQAIMKRQLKRNATSSDHPESPNMNEEVAPD